MSALQTIKEILPVSTNEGIETQLFECQNCSERFESAKNDDRIMCPECLAHEAEVVETA